MTEVKTVYAHVELVAGPLKLMRGRVEPERTFSNGSLGVYVYEMCDTRGKQTQHGRSLTMIPWARVHAVHLDE